MGSNKGKTWEEIYGEEYAAQKRIKTKQISSLPRDSKGKKWEEIYSAEEVARRKEVMKKNNPYHKLSSAQKESRNKKCSEKLKEYYKSHDNPMQGKKHTKEAREKISKTKIVRGEDPSYWKKLRDSFKLRSNEYFEKNKIIMYCAMCCKKMELLPGQYKYKKDRIRKFCSAKCQQHHNIVYPPFNYMPNGWEKKVIAMEFYGLEFTGDHRFWITLTDKDGKLTTRTQILFIIHLNQIKW